MIYCVLTRTKRPKESKMETVEITKYKTKAHTPNVIFVDFFRSGFIRENENLAMYR